MMLPLAEGPLAVHQADSMAQAHSMEHDQFLSAQTIDCEKHFAPREVRSPDRQDLVHRHHFVSLKDGQDGRLRIRMLVLIDCCPLRYRPTGSNGRTDSRSTL